MRAAPAAFLAYYMLPTLFRTMKKVSSIAPLFFCGVLICSVLTGCNPGENLERGFLSYNASDVFGADTQEHALAIAAARGEVAEVDKLVKAGVNVNAVGRHDITPLWWAQFAANFDGFAALLDHGANPNVQRADGYPIMLLIAEQKDPRFLEAALKHGGNPNFRDRSSGLMPLSKAVLRGYKPQIEMLLAADADANARDPISGESLPMIAIGARVDYQLAYELFRKGADPSAKLTTGQTIVDLIDVRSVNASNNDDPWRKKVLEYLHNKGVTAKNHYN